MLQFLTITGISLFIILLYFNVRKYPSSVYLGIFFFLVSLYCFYKYATLFSKSVFLVSITFVHTGFLFYLIGPVLYWYIRSILTDNPHLKKKDFWHLLPMLVFLITSIPYFMKPYTQKVSFATEIVEDINFLGTFHATSLFEIISPFMVFLSCPFLILCYTIWSIVLFSRYIRRRTATMVLSGQYFMTGWLTVLLGFTFILSLAQFIIIFKTFEENDSGLFFSLNLLQVISVTGLTGLIISPFFFPRILYGLPRLPERYNTLDAGVEKPDLPQEEMKKHTLNLEADYLLTINRKADLCMKELQPYLQPDFNLVQLSVLIHIPVHHLSYYFREERKQSFHDYLNIWRVNYAKNLIRQGNANGMTLEAIGKMSGFSNRNSFRIIFEKVEGIYPSTFAAHINKAY